MNNKVEITVNGKTLEHNIGDHWYLINFANGGFTPVIIEFVGVIKEIRISDKGRIEYFDDCGCELSDSKFKSKGYFWTRKEAEKWIEENIPKNPKITKHTAIFTVEGTILEKHFINGMTYANGAFRYRVALEDWYIAEEDFGKTVFFTYEEAKTVRDKFEEEYYKEDIND